MPKHNRATDAPLSETEADATIHSETRRLQTDPEHLPIIKVLGMSGAGKSTLVKRLRAAGYNARAVSQEHSEVPRLWREFGRALVLIYLTLTLDTQEARREDVSWTPEYFKLEERRLASARANADLRIDTSKLTPEEVYAIALAYLRRAKVLHADRALQPLPSTGSASHRTAGATDTPSQA